MTYIRRGGDIYGLSRLRHDHDGFVTDDKHFLDRREQLAALGVRHILTPEEALQYLANR